MTLLKCENLELGYEGRTIAKDISFSVDSGDYLCIVGENGSGKSTLMKTILGLHKAMAGTITFCSGFKQTSIGYLPQQTVVQRDFPASVEEIVRSGCLNHQRLQLLYTKEQKGLARDNMEKLGIADLAKSSYRELSGGQQQRVLLARALCATRELLLLDEPTAGLDPVATEEMYQVIKCLNDEGLTVIMISHDIEGAKKYASTVLHMSYTPLFFGKAVDYEVFCNSQEKGGQK
ncbi:zinc transport system ATP-binding protein [Lachnospiraceae bacterium PF1-21]|uniref:metal ABC transporter ATP-binding protein n=1 Tax=Ohessyouella blattaphilus TaxID=2949333 RepID=UPI003E2DF472